MGCDWWKVMIKHEKTCVIDQPEDLDFQQEAIDAWNKRAPQAEVVWPEPVAYIQTDRPALADDPLNHELVWSKIDATKDAEPLYTREQVEAMLSQKGQA